MTDKDLKFTTAGDFMKPPRMTPDEEDRNAGVKRDKNGNVISEETEDKDNE